MSASSNTETELLNALRIQYEGKGYRFVSHPTDRDLPRFLKGLQPDAVAFSGKENVVIEIKARRSSADRSRMPEITKLVEQHPGWKFRVYYGVQTKPQLYGRPTKAALNSQLEEARAAFRSGHLRAAIVLAWGALEATARAMSTDEEKMKAMLPRELINWLEQEGHIEPETRHALRELVPIRNAIVHGSTDILVNDQHWSALEEAVASLLETIE